MRKNILIFSAMVYLIVGSLVLSGCTLVFQKGRRIDVEKISRLKKQLDELARAKQELENRLRQEIKDEEVVVVRKEKGLVITFLAEVLFDSGKAKLRKDALPKLDKVARVLKTTVQDLSVGIEGHTDNDPIKYSKWKSNWELSAARALSVLHYLEDEHGIDPKRLSAIGYGEYHPVMSNDTPEGKQKNRRVEIVIIPPTKKKK